MTDMYCVDNNCSSDTVNLRIDEIRTCVAPVILGEEIAVSDTAHVSIWPLQRA